jgi:hypothetical protein
VVEESVLRGSVVEDGVLLSSVVEEGVLRPSRNPARLRWLRRAFCVVRWLRRAFYARLETPLPTRMPRDTGVGSRHGLAWRLDRLDHRNPPLVEEGVGDFGG